MVSQGRSVPRFLPTLTEIVHPPAGAAPMPSAALAPVDADAILESVRNEVERVLQTHLEATVANAMLDQVAAIVARIREEIEPMVRRAVADAVAAELDAPSQG